ncbi:SMI1/KNR4 family protein [Streptomyces sp. NPDC000594]|uniref:SMI1/KNR4 family protein n=1 Tax=Streptomyces sp. NPDC000594 TaxID=3154261 RepID=UPI003332BEEF
MSPTFDRDLPPALAAANQADYGHADGDGIEFDPYEAFLSAEDTADWIRDWTGNSDLGGEDFLVFGRDVGGGHAALWLVRPGARIAEQPVVFLGGEGETAVVARDLPSYLWLLADGYGPLEVVQYPDRDPQPHEELTSIAERFAPGARRTGRQVMAEAAGEFPDFDSVIEALCR